MFTKLFEIEKRIQELELYLQCGIYRITIDNERITVKDKIETLKDYKISLENKIKSLYFN